MVECQSLSYQDRADVAQVKSWSEFAGNRTAEMQDISLVFALSRISGEGGVYQMGHSAGRTS